jgi:hypothetical protein
MTTRKSDAEPLLASSAGPNLICDACGQAFYSESAAGMADRPCSGEGCTGRLQLTSP